MIIQVTEEHIKQGRENVRNNPTMWPECCAVAVSLKEMGFDHVEITDETLFVFGKTHCFCVDTPATMKNWIAEFDKGRKVYPATFEINEVL